MSSNRFVVLLFQKVDIFRNIVEDFIETDWRPYCEKLVEKTRDIILATIHQSIGIIFPQENVRYPALQRHFEKQCRTVANALMEDVYKQLHNHLEMEKHPYTQDQLLFENIAEARNRSLKQSLETALKFDQTKQAVYDTQALKTIIDGVFERNRKKSVEEQLAEEMEIVLESYGKVATKRVIDRTPMVCWEAVRSLTMSIQESLWSVTDQELDDIMRESSLFAARHQELSQELDEASKALLVFESLK